MEYNKQRRSFEDELRDDFNPSDLDAASCERYKSHMRFDGRFELLAINRNLARKVDDQVVYKNSAILLFSKNPDAYIPNASVRYVRYLGKKRQSGKNYNVSKDQRFEGNILSLINEVETFIEASLRDYYFLDLDKGLFKKIPEIPRAAWLEGLVNALCHRSYNVQGNPILIRHFDDRLEISNSDPLPAQVTVQNIQSERAARNPWVARVLAELGYVRELNEGVTRIFESMAELALERPEYSDQADTVTLVLRNKVTDHDATICQSTFDRIEKMWEGLNSTERYLINLLFEFQQRDISQLTTNAQVAEQAIRYNLKKLMEKKIVEKVSDKQRDRQAIYRFVQG